MAGGLFSRILGVQKREERNERMRNRERAKSAKAEGRKAKALEKEEQRKAAFRERMTQLGAKQYGTNARLRQRGIIY